MEGEREETVIPLLEEYLRVGKRLRDTGRVRVSVTTGTEARLVQETLRHRLVEIERVPVGREVAEVPPVREEGDTLVIPVLEEILVVERRLVLREEVRLRLRHGERLHEEQVPLRRQEAAIERLPPEPPSQQSKETVAMHTITGLFDSRPEAERAVETLVQQHGIDRDLIQVHAAGSENVTAGTMEARSEDHHGFLASLRDLFMPDEDRATYAEGLRRGGILVSVQVEESQAEMVMDAFEQHGAVDLDAREQEWRQAGWTGAEAGSAPYSVYGSDAVVGPSSDGNRTGIAATTGHPAGTAATTGSATTGSAAMAAGSMAATPMPAAGRTTTATGGEEVIPIVEERLRVGKREVGHGRVRVRSYVVETPVQEQVTLREEHVSIERRPVDRPVTDADRADFQERTIEATETAEEAVVGKEARVREEVVIRKDAEERTETISDTVRRTEIEVDDDRRSAAGATTPKRNPER